MDQIKANYEGKRMDTLLTDHPDFPGADIRLPAEMEGFILGNALGIGSVGRVYKAIQTKEYAVKVIEWSNESDRETAKREYDIGRCFNSCDETLHSLNYYEEEQKSFIIMEYGVPSLLYYINRKCSLRDILNTVLRVAKALELIHSEGYTHFDVKPENIVIVKDIAKLADYSHCAKFSHDQIYDRILGTNIYIAPEITVGGKHTGKEDMYSLGITMYTLLMAGRKPFDFSERESKRRERNDTIDSLYIHPELLKIIQKAAAYDAADRYKDFAAFISDILSFVKKHGARIDDEMPQYRISPSLQRSISQTTISWDEYLAQAPYASDLS